MTMVERVARAIAQSDEQNGGPPYELRVQNKHVKNWLFDQARAAIKEMREPTQKMIDEGVDAPVHDASEVEIIWSAMISAALKEKE